MSTTNEFAAGQRRVPKAKGTVFLGAVQALKQLRDELAIPEHLEAYFEQRIEFLSWYPEQHLREMLGLLADSAGGDRDAALVALGRKSADVHAKEVYQNALRPGSPFFADVLWRAQHDTGALDLERDDEKLVFTLSEFRATSPEICAGITGYLDVAVQRALLRVRPIEKMACVSTGAAACVWRCFREAPLAPER